MSTHKIRPIDTARRHPIVAAHDAPSASPALTRWITPIVETYATATSSDAFRVVSSSNVRAFAQDLLRTPSVRENALRVGGLYHQVIEHLAQAPLILRLPTGEPAERLQFPLWYRVQTLRVAEHADAALSDLYLLHEWRHLTNLTYLHDPDREAWERKMVASEDDATLVSEHAVHAEIPNLPKAVPLSAMLLTQANAAWCEIFWPHAPEVERRMVAFLKEAAIDETKAVHDHVDWLAQVSSDGLPFREASVAFEQAFTELIQSERR